VATNRGSVLEIFRSQVALSSGLSKDANWRDISRADRQQGQHDPLAIDGTLAASEHVESCALHRCSVFFRLCAVSVSVSPTRVMRLIRFIYDGPNLQSMTTQSCTWPAMDPNISLARSLDPATATDQDRALTESAGRAHSCPGLFYWRRCE